MLMHGLRMQRPPGRKSCSHPLPSLTGYTAYNHDLNDHINTCTCLLSYRIYTTWYFPVPAGQATVSTPQQRAMCSSTYCPTSTIIEFDNSDSSINLLHTHSHSDWFIPLYVSCIFWPVPTAVCDISVLWLVLHKCPLKLARIDGIQVLLIRSQFI